MDPRPGRKHWIAPLIAAAAFLAITIGIGGWLFQSFFSQVTSITPSTALAPPALPTATPMATVVIGGTLRTEQGQPARNVSIELSWKRADNPAPGHPSKTLFKRGRAVTDSNGVWTFSGIPRQSLADLELNISDRDFIPQRIENPAMAALLDRSAVYVLSSGFTLTGRILGPDGQPVDRATVTTRIWEGDAADPTAQSDAEGRFILRHVPAGAARVLVTARRFAPQIQDAASQAGAKPLDFHLLPGKTLRGRVVDPSGKPLAQVDVRVQFWQSNQMLRWRKSTDSQGRFEMPDAPPDPVTFSFYKDSYENPTQALTAGTEEQVITLKPLPHFSGHVVDAGTHQPIDRFRVLPGVLWPGWASPIFGFSNAQQFTHGNYILKATGFGGDILAWYVRVDADGYLPAASAPVRVGGEVTLDFALHHGPDVIGRLIESAGNPVAGVPMMLLIPDSAVNISDGRMMSDTGSQPATTGPDGSFRFNPQVGPFEIWAVADAGCAELRTTGSVERSLELKMQPWSRLRLTSLPPSTGPNDDMYLRIRSAADPTTRLNYSNWYYNISAQPGGDVVADRLPATFPDGLAEIEISWQGPRNKFSRMFVAHLTPGQATTLDMAQGTAVTGQIAPDSYGTSPTRRDFQVTLLRTPDGPPDQWPSDWLAAAHACQGANTYTTSVDLHDRFSIPAVAPGTYEYAISAYEDPQLCGAGKVTVPDGIAGAITIPDIVCAPVTRLKVGSNAPDQLGRTLQGKPIPVSEFAGHYVVWMIWDSFTGGRDADSVASANLTDGLAAGHNVALIADNADLLMSAMYGGPPRRPATVARAGWSDGYLSVVDQALFNSLSYFTQNQATTFIIDPSGKIAAANVQPDEVRPTLIRLMGAGK